MLRTIGRQHTWGVGRGRRHKGALIGDADIVQSTRAHELLAVHRVDGPARVTRLPPGRHCLRLQLAYLCADCSMSIYEKLHASDVMAVPVVL